MSNLSKIVAADPGRALLNLCIGSPLQLGASHAYLRTID